MVAPDLPPDGISVALITPVDTAGEPDLDAVDRLVARVIAGGAVGLAPGGSTGEGWRLTPAQRLRLVSRVAAAAGGRPVIAGVPLRTPQEFLAELPALADAGATAVLTAPPGPYPLTEDEVVTLFTRVGDTSPLPLVLYNIPALAGNGFAAGAVTRLAGHPRIAGMKDSSRDLEYQYAVIRATRNTDFRVVTGADTLLRESLALGAVGGIVASPNVAPTLTPALYQAVRAGDAAEAARLRDRVVDVVSISRGSGFPAGWKAAASLVGICGPDLVPPGIPLSSERIAELRQALVTAGFDKELAEVG